MSSLSACFWLVAVMDPALQSKLPPISFVARYLERDAFRPQLARCVADLRGLMQRYNVTWLDARVVHAHFEYKVGVMVEVPQVNEGVRRLVTANAFVIPDGAVPHTFLKAADGSWLAQEFTLDKLPASLWADGSVTAAMHVGVFEQFYEITKAHGLQNILAPSITRRAWLQAGDTPFVLAEDNEDGVLGSVVTAQPVPYWDLPDTSMSVDAGTYRTSWQLHDCADHKSVGTQCWGCCTCCRHLDEEAEEGDTVPTD